MTDISRIPEIQDWIDIVENDTYKCSKDQKLLVKHVKKCFKNEKIHVNTEQLSKYMHLAKEYVPFDLFPWQKFIIALHDCTYWDDSGMPRWPDLFAMLGRGAGKDGTIAVEAFCLTSPYNGIREYDVDICANNEEQAMRPVQDLTGFFEEPKILRKIKKFYDWTKEKITCSKTKSTVKGRTNSPKGKDGLRSGIVIFNEIHQYENYDNINVFTTGLGKKEHPRRSYYTTNGDVREGPLDDLLEDAEGILQGEEDDNGLLPFICRLDSKKEVDDEANWTKANPSLPYLPNLLAETRKEYREWKKNPERLPAFMSKRMNLPAGAKEAAEKKIKIDCTVSSYNASIDEIAKALEKLGKAGHTIGEKQGSQKEQPMSNNRRKMKGIPMIRRQQLRRAQRNRRKKTNGWQQLGERKYWNQEENVWCTHKQ